MKLISLYFFSLVISSKLIYEPVEIVKDEKKFLKKVVLHFFIKGLTKKPPGVLWRKELGGIGSFPAFISIIKQIPL